MKIKLTTLLFGLLLAVGWTSSAFAQDLYLPTAVHNKAYYDKLTYTWTDANNVTHTSKATDVANDPYQMYELIRFVYGNPAFPGPTYGAYTSSFTVEDPIHYHPVKGGWNIVAAGNSNPRDIKITANNDYAMIQSIEVKSGSTVITSWTNGQAWPPTGENWSVSGTATISSAGYLYISSSTTITIPASKLTDYSNVDVVVKAYDYYANYYAQGYTSYYGSVIVNGTEEQFTGNSNNIQTKTWNITLPEEGAFVQGTVAAPTENGYTALIVALKNEATAASESGSGITGQSSTGSYFNNKEGYINYFKDRIAFIKLLTDGLRIGNEEEHSTGTIFNCAGTYNKFFIISKGRAREKSDQTKSYRIGNTNDWWNSTNWYYGEVFPFQDMFEEFSPTTGAKGDQITDFYTEMMDGKIYSVVHDCASVIQESHQFSMSGNSGTQAYAMDGLNFFIPDFRLLYWMGKDSVRRNSYSAYTYFNCDGRDIMSYQEGNETGKINTYHTDGRTYYWSAYFAQYNPKYAPKIGIYKITLEADAQKAPNYNSADPKYEVTLNWVSSLNEMTGDMVPQTYTIYKVTYDSIGNEKLDTLAIVADETSYTYQVPQGENSYTITYIIEGHPTPDENSNYPSFVAWSNLDDVVIPGLSDFLTLVLDHYESDFVIGSKLGEEKNYYRNFLHVTGDNDGEKALTVERINAGENEFKLYRQTVIPESSDETLIGTLTFTDRKDGLNVGYGFTFEPGQDVLDYTVETEDGTITNAYEHRKIGMPSNNNGFDLRIKGNGDIVIHPNGYAVNFKSITVKNGNTTVASWVVNDGDIVTNKGWYLSPGSRWIKDPGTDYYYLEGGGYIAIPDMLNTYTDLTVTINGFGDAGNLATISVNDRKQTLTNATDNNQNAKDYTWNVTSKYYKYVKVTSQSDLIDGEYLIVNDANKVAFNGSKANLDAAANYVNVDIFSNEIASSTLIDDAVFIIDMNANGTGTIKSSSGLYIGGLETDRNGMQQSADNAFTNSITINQTAIGDVVYNAVITNNGKYLRYNPQSGQNRFRYLKQENLEPIHLYKKVEATVPATTHSIRLVGLPIIDQFSENVAHNDHPSRYGYILKYTPKANAQGEYPDPNTDAGKAKSSSRVEVPVQHTASNVNGYYTEDTVKKDEDRKLKLDIMAADMDMTLSGTNSAIYYYTILSSKNEMPHNNDSTYYVSNMQQNNFKYQEMYTKSDLHGQVYEAGEHHYFDSVPETGSYSSSYKTYVPYIKQRAIERYYYASDSLHNTYGSPVWATGVGKVDNVSADVQPQQGWNTTWTDNGNCRLYMLNNVMAEGYLPLNTKTDGSVLSNIEYEPYMFRIFVESPSGSLRHFQYVTDDNGNEVIAAKADTTNGKGPWCVWSEYINFKDNGDIKDNPTDSVKFGVSGNVITFEKKKVERTAATQDNPNPEWDKDANNAIFGALTSIEAGENKPISEDDLMIYVRFYYKSTGKPIESLNNIMLRADAADADKSFYAVEKSATAKQGPTAVKEILYHGEIVSQTYFNVQGMESDKPFDGINIVVTRYSDGATSVSKVVR